MVELPSTLRRNWLFLVLLGGPTLLVLTSAWRLGGVHVQESAVGHVIATGAVAMMATLLAILLGSSVHKTSGGAVVLLSVGYLAVGITMAGHGLLTEGVGTMVHNPWAERLPWLAVIIYAATLALASETSGVLIRWSNSHRRVLFGAAILGIAGPIALLVADPLRFGSTRYSWESDANTALAVVVVMLSVMAGRGQWRRWRLGGDLVLLALAVSAATTIATTVSLRFGEQWQLSWWDSHIYLLIGFGGVIAAALAPVSRRPREALTLDRALADDPLVHISAGYPEALRVLARAVEAKDPYTHGHSVRLAEITVRLAVRLGLDADQLRILARGSLLHDVGKISIPREILNKRSELDPLEREVIERHPELGAELVSHDPELLDLVDVVLHHHERWDGSGYPSGLIGDEIPLLARVCAVADVWDALTTDRAYRRGWGPELALDHLTENAGKLFDPDVVEAMLDYARRELGHVGSVPPPQKRVERVGAMHLL